MIRLFMLMSALSLVAGQTYRINTNGPAFVDANQNAWSPDAYFQGTGSTYASSANPIDTDGPAVTSELLYQTERYKDDVYYKFPVTNGNYKVVLHFAEIYEGTDEVGQRVFNVFVEGTKVLNEFDITKEVGAYTAVAKSFDITVTDGFVDITFEAIVENPKINGVEIIPSNESPPPTTPAPTPKPTPKPTPQPTPVPAPGADVDIYINAGGDQVTDSSDITWSADNFFSTTSSSFQSGTTISGAGVQGRDALYQVERYENGDANDYLTYSIPVPRGGTYTVTLHWAEIYFGAAFARQFDVEIQGQPVFENVDIFAEVGFGVVYIETSPEFQVANGDNVEIKFKSRINNGKINAIEVHSVGGQPPPPTPTPAPTPKPTPTPTPPGPTLPASTFDPIYINCGGGLVTDDAGIMWDPDTGFFSAGTSTYSTGADIGDVDDILQKLLFRTERYENSGGSDMTYTIPLEGASGSFFVTLYFAEIYVGGVGQRQFDVRIQNSLRLENYDIVFEAGGPFKAVSETFEAFVAPGNDLIIKLTSKINNAKISAIEIQKNAIPPPPSPTPKPTPVPPQPTTPPPNPIPMPQWIDLNENESYTARHECSFVQAGNKMYLFGGRESPRKMDTYDYASNTWSTSDMPDTGLDFNHFQAIEYEGLIWVIGAYRTNEFPDEVNAENIYVYDPANNAWMTGPEVPASRRRGSGGLQVYNGKFYLVGGNNAGHAGGFVKWFDSYDPRTGQWQVLADAPNARDHFHAVVVGNRLYAAGGRRTSESNTFGDTVAKVDVYDFSTGVWLPPTSTPDDLPVPRAAAATASFNGKIILAGGESGSQTTAYNRVDELDPVTGTWSTLAPMKYSRHGTQALVSGNGIFVAAGSPVRGQGKQRNMEVYNQNAPAGVASVAGTLSSTASTSPLDIPLGAPRAVTIQQSGGNQGVFVNSITLTGPQASGFAITSGFPAPILIPNGQTHNVFVEYTGTQNDAQAQLLIVYSDDQVLVISLLGKQSSQPPSPLVINDFVIVSAAEGTDIGSVDSCNGCITASNLISIRAEPVGAVGSVRLILTGPQPQSMTENVAPYSLYGDSGGNYNGKKLTPGTYTISAQAFSSSNLGGTSGPVATETFSVS